MDKKIKEKESNEDKKKIQSFKKELGELEASFKQIDKINTKSIDFKNAIQSKLVKKTKNYSKKLSNDEENNVDGSNSLEEEKDTANSDNLIKTIKINSLPYEDFFQNHFINLDLFLSSDEYKSSSVIDFSGIETLTDFFIWYLKKHLANNSNLKVEYFLFNGCSNLSIWSVHYLNQMCNKNLLDLPVIPLNQRFACCPRISEILMASLSYDNLNYVLKHESLSLSLFNESKIVILNSNSFNPNLTDKLNKSLTTVSSDHNKFFKYIKFKNSKNKILNIYECSESIAEIFLSERNSIVVTFNPTDDLESIKTCILSRLLLVMSKNIIPTSIIILGVGDGDQDLLIKIQKIISDNLNSLKKSICKTLDTIIDPQISLFSKESSKLSFQYQLELSSQLNLSEHIDLVLNILNYGLINPEKSGDTFLGSATKPKYEVIQNELTKYLNIITDIGNSITKSDMAELKAFKAPPARVVLIAEAMCYFFAKSASYENFVKLVNSSDFISSLKNYNLNNVSDFAIKNVKKYIEMEQFNPDAMMKVSRLSSILCRWILAVYDYCILVSSINKFSSNDLNYSSSSNSLYSSLTEYLYNNSFFMFHWHMFYNEEYEDNENYIDELIAKNINLDKRYILSIDNLNDLFESNKDLKKRYSKENFKNLALQFARAQHAKGNFYLSKKLIVTDINWLSNIFDILSSENIGVNSNSLEFLGKISIWSLDELKKRLNNFCQDETIFHNLLDFLIEKNLILITNEKLLVPIFNIQDNHDEKLKAEWPKIWPDLEYQITWELFSPMPFNAFAEFIQYFFNEDTCVQIWKTGLWYKDTNFDALIRYSEKKLRLCVRMIDPEKIFNLENKTYLRYFKWTYMKFYMILKYLLTKFNICHQIKVDEILAHPIKDSTLTNDSINTRDLIQFNNLILENDNDYFKEMIQNVSHFFKQNDKKQLECIECNMNFEYYIRLKDIFNFLYPKFEKIQFFTKEMVDVYSSPVKLCEPAFSNDESYYLMELKFFEDDLIQRPDILLVIDFNDTEKNLWINLQKMEINFPLSELEKLDFIKIVKCLFSNKSYLSNQVSLGDELKIEKKKTGDNIKNLKVFINGITMLEIEYTNLNLKPIFSTSDLSGSSFENTYDFAKCLKLNNFTPEKNYAQNDLNHLLNFRLEAKDRKNPTLIAPASIIGVTNNLVLIHFDGWGSSFDYWTEINNEDLRPIGWYEYQKQKGLSNFSIFRFDPPKDYNKIRPIFEWETYLAENGFSAVPFDYFTSEQKFGMTLADFKGDKSQLIGLPCNYSPNLRLKIKKFNKFMNENWSNILEKKIIMSNDSVSVPTRGILLLPKDINDLILKKKTSFFNKPFMHMFCLTKVSDNLYAHLLDSGGILIDKKMMDTKDLITIMISTYCILNSILPTIVPEENKIFTQSNGKLNDTQLTAKIRSYLKEQLNYLNLLVDQNEISNLALNINIKKYLDLIPAEEQSAEIFKFQKTSNNSFGQCYFCYLADHKYNPSTDSNFSIEKKFNSYSKFCSYLSLIGFNSSVITIDSKFVENYQNLSCLNLINTRLEIQDPKLFSQFKYLADIKLVNNNIKCIPESILRMENLKNLTYNNKIDYSTLNFEKTTNLELLELDSIETNEKIIRINDKLKILRVFRSSLDKFCFELKPEPIKELKLGGVSWLNMDKYSKNDSLISEENLISELSKCKLLPLNALQKLFQYFDQNQNGYLDSIEILKLNAYIFKKFKRIGPEVPKIIFEMKNLNILDLSYQAIKEIPDGIENLKNLKSLILSNCILLETISAKLANLELKKIDLNCCFSLINPPPEIVKRGMSSIMAFLRRLISGSVELKRTKLMLVGLGEAGKTSLLTALKNEYDDKPQVTDGIDIDDWIIELPDGSNLTFSMWDFAGQSVYYNTHQFFLSSRAVYLLVWNVRLGSEYAGLEFWLSSISCHAPGAPILIVGTHIDQVSKYSLDQEDLKSRFKQIAGFHFVSSWDGTGIENLRQKIIEITLQEKYIGEKVPEVWLNFEKSIEEKAVKESLTSFDDIKILAEKNGIYDQQEVLQAVKFLSDLGSLQYFENKILKDKVIINPRWIVNAFSKIVSIKETAIKDGILQHDKIKEIWKDYNVELHEWMLKLTEEFDLTFSVRERNFSIVPCLLPETEPKIEWPEIDLKSSIKIKELKVIYSFDYLPIGLFNRIQVRLYEYGENSIIWKKGSLLKKNSHIALLSQSKNALSIQIKVQGIKPENIIFVIHETIENLINESFNGLKYDVSFPCPECVEVQSNEPHQFSSSLLKRAEQMKAPFLQCCKYFHTVSIEEMLTLIPMDDSSSLDLNLEYSIRDLKHLKKKFKYDIMFWYCKEDLNLSKDKSIDPQQVIKAIESQGYRVWSSKNPQDEKLDYLTSIIKQSKLIIFGISDNFSNDDKCIQIFKMTKNLIKKSYLLIEFGLIGGREWLKDPLFASACTDFRIIMQDPKRYNTKIADMFESIEKMLQYEIKTGGNKPDVFISYCWANSHDAIKKGSKGTKTSLGWLDPRSLVKFFEDNGIKAWLDIDNLDSTTQMFGEITKGMNLAKVMIACVSDEYVESVNCKLEFRFAHISLKIPIIKAVVGQGNEWRKNEIAFLGSCYPETNFQYKTAEAYSLLLKHVKEELERCKDLKSPRKIEDNQGLIESNNSAYQELYELTQRKFLRQLKQFSDSVSTIRSYPRLFCIDLIDQEKIDKLSRSDKIEFDSSKTEIDDEKNINQSNLIPCVRSMCEHEESWHFSECVVVLPKIISSFCPYLTRIMTILRNGNLSNDLAIFLTQQGLNLISEIEDKSKNETIELSDSYNSLRNYFISEYESGRFYSFESVNSLNLEKCELKSGKILWLCKKHVEENNAKILSDQKISSNIQIDQKKNKLIEELDKVQIDEIILNEN